jgi:hypothetical protein
MAAMEWDAERQRAEEVEIAKAFPPTPPLASPAPVAEMPKRLPKAASPLPLVGLIGLPNQAVIAILT